MSKAIRRRQKLLIANATFIRKNSSKHIKKLLIVGEIKELKKI